MTYLDNLYKFELANTTLKRFPALRYWNSALFRLIDLYGKASLGNFGSCCCNPDFNCNGREVVVSLTSMPDRIEALRFCLNSVFQQTVKPTRLILWIETENYPLFCKELANYVAYGLEIRECDDLKPHKKYFNAFTQFNDSIVITLDDDVYYPSYTLEKLIDGYRDNPDSVICWRAHRIGLEDDGTLKPYLSWEGCVEANNSPDPLLMPTGIGGILYEPWLYGDEYMDTNLIESRCLYADDIWLKAMTYSAGCGVVCVNERNIQWATVRGSGKGLADINVKQSRNDAYAKDVFVKCGLARPARDGGELI